MKVIFSSRMWAFIALKESISLYSWRMVNSLFPKHFQWAQRIIQEHKDWQPPPPHQRTGEKKTGKSLWYSNTPKQNFKLATLRDNDQHFYTYTFSLFLNSSCHFFCFVYKIQIKKKNLSSSFITLHINTHTDFLCDKGIYMGEGDWCHTDYY